MQTNRVQSYEGQTNVPGLEIPWGSIKTSYPDKRWQEHFHLLVSEDAQGCGWEDPGCWRTGPWLKRISICQTQSVSDGVWTFILYLYLIDLYLNIIIILWRSLKRSISKGPHPKRSNPRWYQDLSCQITNTAVLKQSEKPSRYKCTLTTIM